jgi:hypothetical protein
MTDVRRGLRVTSAILVAAATLTACASEEDERFEDLPVGEIEDEVRADMGALESLAFTGSMTTEGVSAELSLRADRDGNCAGTARAAGVTVQIIRTGEGGNFMKGDAQFWRALGGPEAQQLARRVGSQWAKLGTQDRFSAFCDLDGVLAQLNRGDSEGSTASKGEEREVDGRPVIEIVSRSGGSTTTALVLLDDPHHVVELTTTGEAAGRFTFSGFDEPVEAEAPADFVDLG